LQSGRAATGSCYGDGKQNQWPTGTTQEANMGTGRARGFAGLALLAGLAAGSGRADEPQPAAAVRATFDEAIAEIKKLMADLTVLQAQYQQPKADRAALAAEFERKKAAAEAAGKRLEDAAVAVLAVSPEDPGAREIASGVMAGSLQADDPEKTLAIASALDAGGAVDGDTALLAATAAVILSRLDVADAWLEKAAAKAKPAQVAEVRATVDHDRAKVEAELARRKAEAEADDLPRVKLSTSAGDVTVELFENEAPNTVANFLTLVEKGFYDGTPFHRVIGGFMAQGGDPTGTGSGGPGHAIACECAAPNARLHFRGSLSMAHAGQDTGGSQFFLTFRPTEHLDGKHTVFGRVIAGDEVLAKLVRTQDGQGRPVPGVEPDKILKAEVLRKRDHAYDPVTIPGPRK
jgi:cyclophilin family peptidyl-prolyl cis-trans isomerase